MPMRGWSPCGFLRAISPSENDVMDGTGRLNGRMALVASIEWKDNLIVLLTCRIGQARSDARQQIPTKPNHSNSQTPCSRSREPMNPQSFDGS
jgi:hypothetical protein